MKYTRDTTLGDHQIYEVYEGSPEEIAELDYLMDNEVPVEEIKVIRGKQGIKAPIDISPKEEIVYDEEDVLPHWDIDEATNYILEILEENRIVYNGRNLYDLIRDILEIETYYMKSIGIIE